MYITYCTSNTGPSKSFLVSASFDLIGLLPRLLHNLLMSEPDFAQTRKKKRRLKPLTVEGNPSTQLEDSKSASASKEKKKKTRSRDAHEVSHIADEAPEESAGTSYREDGTVVFEDRVDDTDKMQKVRKKKRQNSILAPDDEVGEKRRAEGLFDL